MNEVLEISGKRYLVESEKLITTETKDGKQFQYTAVRVIRSSEGQRRSSGLKKV